MNINIFFCLLLSFIFLGSQEKECTNKYWNDIKEENKESILNSETIYDDALKYYKGEFNILDNERTLKLLDTLTSLEQNLKPLYFYLFNKICYKSDGALAGVIGKYCQKILLNDPQYVFGYFKKDKRLFNKYTDLLGYELYFKNKGTSSIKYNIKDFNKILTEKMNKYSGDIKQQKQLFFNKLKEVMKSME
jgi:hypothetical protein